MEPAFSNRKLDSRSAYLAAVEFLRGYYERTGSDDVGSLLGDMSLVSDGVSADPAAVSDWEVAIRSVLDSDDGSDGAAFQLIDP